MKIPVRGPTRRSMKFHNGFESGFRLPLSGFRFKPQDAITALLLNVSKRKSGS
jgi:hypothetical protein